MFLNDEQNKVDEDTIMLLFNCINKYGDRSMNQEFFFFLNKKSYTSFLCLREKTKSDTNFIKYLNNFEKTNQDTEKNTNENPKAQEINNNIQNNNYKNRKKMNFTVNCFCTENENCNEPCNTYIKSYFNNNDQYIEFTCAKCKKKQKININCFYDDDSNGEKYQINFELLSPLTLLNNKWFKNSNILNPFNVSEEYPEDFLSAIFYFYEQGLPCGFLLPNYPEINEPELKEYKENKQNIFYPPDLNAKFNRINSSSVGGRFRKFSCLDQSNDTEDRKINTNSLSPMKSSLRKRRNPVEKLNMNNSNGNIDFKVKNVTFQCENDSGK